MKNQSKDWKPVSEKMSKMLNSIGGRRDSLSFFNAVSLDILQSMSHKYTDATARIYPSETEIGGAGAVKRFELWIRKFTDENIKCSHVCMFCRYYCKCIRDLEGR